MRRLLAALALLLAFAASAHAEGVDRKAVVAAIVAKGDALVAAYDPAKGDAVGDGVSDLYFNVFEESGLEAEIGAADPNLKAQIESLFSGLIGKAMKGAPKDQVQAGWDALKAKLEALVGQGSGQGWLGAFLQSLLILLREGFEAILVIGALVAYLRRLGGAGQVRVVWIGVAIALALSLVTAWALDQLLKAAGPDREAVGGLTMVIAAAVLAYVSHWLYARREAARWQGYIKGQVEKALSGGQLLSLGFAAFLAVYREGAETVLFYQALASGAPGQGSAIAAGLALATLGLVAIFWVMNKASTRLPLGPFFTATALLLYVLAVSFAGQGILEMQEARWVAATPIDWAPAIPTIGVYPTVETLGAQALVLSLLLPVLGAAMIKRKKDAA